MSDGYTQKTGWANVDNIEVDDLMIHTFSDVPADRPPITATQMKFDAVNKPKHYNSLYGKLKELEVIDVIEGLGFGNDYLMGNVIKYISRYKLKGGKQDLEKAMWYLKRKIDKMTNEEDYER